MTKVEILKAAGERAARHGFFGRGLALEPYMTAEEREAYLEAERNRLGAERADREAATAKLPAWRRGGYFRQ